MIKNALALWRKEKTHKGTSLHRRLILFFVLISVFLILAFTLALTLFGMNGKEAKTVANHIDTELYVVSESIADDFDRISLGGISIAERISAASDDFFAKNKILPNELAEHPELIEPLLSEHMPTLISTINNHYCGGVFMLLDATIKPNEATSPNNKAGIFIKKTQPTSTQDVNVKLHYLRGPAKLARENNMMLLGQWKMEYNISGQDFFDTTINTARSNPDLPLSRLYYWSGRVTLKGNSEAGFLLCVPLRASDGTVFGICGIEISDRMFKSLFSPEGGSYDNIFTVAGPSCKDYLCTSEGIIAGNYYLTGTRLSENLYRINSKDEFEMFSTSAETYGGKSTEIHLYPKKSPYYEDNAWSVAVLMPENVLKKEINGNIIYFIYIVITLLIISLIASVFISKKYLKPVTAALHSIKHTPHAERRAAPYLEINDLFEFLAEKDKEHEEQIRLREEHNQQMKDEVAKAIDEYEKAQLEISRLAYSRKQEIDPDLYQTFLDHLSTLTPTERNVFDLYISGKSAKEILEIMDIKENTLKYHNKNIYSKLGVSSRKELLRYATLMKQESKEGTS